MIYFLRSFSLFAFILFFSIVTAFAQTGTDPKKKKDKKKLNLSKEAKIADAYFKNMEYFLATEYYNKSLKVNPKDHYSMYQVAECYRGYFDYTRAEKAYQQVVNAAPKDFPLARYWFATMLKNNGKYDLSKDNFEQFLKEFQPETADDELIKKQAKIEYNGCILVINEYKKPIRNYEFTNLKSPVNTSSSDYAALPYGSDSVIVITSSRKGSKGNDIDSRMGESYSDNYRFHLVGENWSKLPDSDNFDIVNTDRNDGAGIFTDDKNRYFYSSCVEGECAIYMSEKKAGKWTKPVRLNDNVNYPEYDNFQPALSRNADTLYFVSKRPGGFGMSDIWFSVFSNGDWGPAVNMGDHINTIGIDMSPFYYYKDNAFFFSSTGREGFGGLDVFIATGKDWTKVRNLGLPFNSNRDDFYFALGNKVGYLSSNRVGGLGSDDVYSFSIDSREAIIAMIYRDSIDKYKSISVLAKMTFKPDGDPAVNVPVFLMDENGNILFSKSSDRDGIVRFDNLASNRKYSVKSAENDPNLNIDMSYIEDNFKSFSVLGNLKYKGIEDPAVDVEIELVDDGGLVMGSMRTNKEGGIRFDNINSDKNYRLRVAGGETKITAEFDFSMDNLALLGSVYNETKTLFENIYFDLDRADLRPESRQVLEDLVAFVKKHPEVQVEMRAYTDALGSDDYNFELSKKRGDAARAYLGSKGLPSTTLVVKPMGKGRPIASNENPIGRQLNRRIEFYIVGGPGYNATSMAYVPSAKESLEQIAQQFGMTVEDLKKLNSRKANEAEAYEPLRVRRVGDADIIAPVTMTASSSAPSDSLLQLSMQRLAGDTAAIAALASKRAVERPVGSITEEYEPVGKVRLPPVIELGPGEEFYVVEPENTLYGIARKYGMKADELKQLNGFTSNYLKIGQRIKVKRMADVVVDETQYAVKEGDTMFSIAQKFNLSVDQLKKLNNLESNMLFERMVLKVKP